MGQALRAMRYDSTANEVNAVSALSFSPGEALLKWWRLDDGVMGGQSETKQEAKDGGLLFTGIINTNGGGFCSVRATLPTGLPSNTEGFRLQYRGDGKTYKLLLSEGHTGGKSKTPLWEYDVPTEARKDGDKLQEKTILLDDLQASFMGSHSGKTVAQDHQDYKFDPSKMTQIGLMLSMKLSDGSPNPKATFGEGTFPFSLFVKSINLVTADKK